MAAPDKAADAFRTIGELSRETGIPQHILRYWETRFPQLRPLQRAGNRRYYRTEDAALVRRIQALLDTEGYTIRGVQKLLGEEAPVKRGGSSSGGGGGRKTALLEIRDALAAALTAD
ncbi:MerR family transcriptional regulator [Sphingomonas donggukensis]|uniref:MerR family transcriptional regulator n=1 Tax=Sphingomonas donggukensis TaxID=2949093 RepID=A0ABY4TS61_9SPHN|nr:MerR family transcriptional regulator [Sphingomonas donggukensis]URW75239.1 MerR family transcriptional regulator [Sphingomonas donggukensis]